MKKYFTLFVLVLIHCLSNAQSGIVLQQFSTGYTAPVAIENCGDSRLFIVQQSGQIIISDSTGTKLSTPFLDISSKIIYGGERGLLGLAFDPNYSTNGSFYVYYIDTSGNTQVSRFKRSSSNLNLAYASSEHKILNITQPFTNHKGGCIHFGPDGYLYISTGDGGSGGDPNNNAQNPQSLLGKMLRIDVHHGTSTSAYTIPADNPFVDSANYRKEIWALGLRNPWRWSFDFDHGRMIIGDVGQDNWEEVDYQSRTGGKNYGWRCYEGNHAYNTTGCNLQSSYQAPVYEYSHASGDCAIIGGYIYRGKKYSYLQGKYFFTDYCSGVIRTLFINYPTATLQDTYQGATNVYSCFGQDSKRELYLADLNGIIYHIASQSTGKDAVAETTVTAFSIAPNPSSGSFIVTYKSDKTQQVIMHIQNMVGQQFYTSKQSLTAGTNNVSINVRLPHDDYFVGITDASGKTSYQRLRIE